MLNETSQLLSDSVEKIFSDHVTKDCIISAEKGECHRVYGMKLSKMVLI